MHSSDMTASLGRCPMSLSVSYLGAPSFWIFPGGLLAETEHGGVGLRYLHGAMDQGRGSRTFLAFAPDSAFALRPYLCAFGPYSLPIDTEWAFARWRREPTGGRPCHSPAAPLTSGVFILVLFHYELRQLHRRIVMRSSTSVMIDSPQRAMSSSCECQVAITPYGQRCNIQWSNG